MKRKKSFWIVIGIIMLLYGTILELSKNVVAGWIAAGIVFTGYIVFAMRFLEGKKPQLRVAGWVCLSALLVLVYRLSAPPYKAVPATELAHPESTDIVTVRQGQLTGVYNEDKSVEVYAGIPYAKPPVGELRWKEPQEPESWEGIRVCDHFAPMSMQGRNHPLYDSLVTMMFYHNYKITLKDNYREPVSEDSLYLNVWKPAGEIKDVPVLVYIHGGSLMTGQTYYSEYNGETLAQKGIIVVNLAYRLGVFGYLATEELAAESPNGTTGNYGLLDQIQALKWIHENIEAFGGDPDQITIAGESAGASSVNALCVSPLTEGLFRYAIAESSGITAKKPFHTFRDFDDALQTGSAIMQEMGAGSIDELRQMDAEKLLATEYRNDTMTVDGYAIDEQPYLTYEKGENHEQALLNGFNSHEANVFNLFYKVTDQNYLDYLRNDFGDYAEQIAELYPAGSYPVDYNYLVERGGNAKGAINRVLGAAWFGYSHYTWSNYMIKQNKPVYQYYFTKDNRGLRANHAGELPYAYGNLWRNRFLYDEADEQLSDRMTDYWVNFVKYGDPNGDGLPTWEEYAADTDKLLELGETVSMIDQPYSELFAIIDAYQEQFGVKRESDE
ncbi:MAG: carboxylesterase family protein [Lachnospiraceae bacterium]|nr:carboxylesterase family protein [Lachnospiraceae bacterium]